MKTDFDLLTYKFDNEILIVPIFDVHYGAENFDEKNWKRTKNFILNNDNVYCVWGGDIIDNQTKNSHNPYGSTVRPFEQRQWYKKQVLDLKEKTLCGTLGNHTLRKDNVATDELLDFEVFDNAGIADRFRKNVCLLKIQIGNRKDSYRQSYVLEITHSTGSSTTVGSAINRQEKALNIYEGLDCVIVGHSHKACDYSVEREIIDTKNNKVIKKIIQIIISPSYLSYGDYAVRSQLQPSPYEDKVIKLTMRKDKKIVKYNDYDDAVK